MLPLLRVPDHRISTEKIRVSIIDDPPSMPLAREAAVFVTTGLLNRATDDQLRGVLADEIAPRGLGHPAKAQIIGSGLNIVALLEQLFLGSSSFTPLPAL